ncbi:phosphoribosyltransferase [Methylocapsa palsarum]|uniref:Hypoxanthine phosphoribosyltransferase n=1 Tax=Methylocapsa palsarum TaxID=1612308 RepID=A0A1I4BH13_9HYPH|nr:phosphoribosyltransferase [Methylocapsa palsarum]SFK68115.1 Hypoxanthine phosphoribosyltransferase [Methylocapsa palsarum]
MQDLDAMNALDEKYIRAPNHTLHMTIEEAENLSRLLARRIKETVGQPDLLVGIANGALMTTSLCSDELGAPSHIVQVRREGSRYKRRLLKIKEFIPIPSSWILFGPLKTLWGKFQNRYSKLEVAEDSFGRDVAGLNVVVIDDCTVTGNSIIYVADRLKAQGAGKVSMAVLCWTEKDGSMERRPEVYLHRNIQWYPWSNNSEYWPAYLNWLKQRKIEQWL